MISPRVNWSGLDQIIAEQKAYYGKTEPTEEGLEEPARPEGDNGETV